MQSTRQDILLYLLTHLILPTRDSSLSRGGALTPWTEYIKFLPRPIPVPTMWNECERALLQGTSLEVDFLDTCFFGWTAKCLVFPSPKLDWKHNNGNVLIRHGRLLFLQNSLP